jgi:hypothetical protein
MVGDFLWAVTPLRETVLGGGRFPGHPVFRPYNLVLIVIAVLLAAGLLALHGRYGGAYGRLGTAGVVVIFAGCALLFLGSIPAVLFMQDGPLSLIRTGQDLGFFGALVSLLGALLLGIALWRARLLPRLGALLLIIALPAGLVGVILLSVLGFEDTAGLPWTVLYGAAWVVLGNDLWARREGAARPRVN